MNKIIMALYIMATVFTAVIYSFAAYMTFFGVSMQYHSIGNKFFGFIMLTAVFAGTFYVSYRAKELILA